MSSFGNRRKARKIGGDDESWGNDNEGTVALCLQQRLSNLNFTSAKRLIGLFIDGESVVKRPALSSKAKQKSKLRLSFNPADASLSGDEYNSGDTGVVTPKKLGLGRKALEKGVFARSASSTLPINSGSTGDRPSYSQDYLNELRSSVPSTPKDLKPSGQVSEDEYAGPAAIDVAAKFGEVVLANSRSAIPTEAEIREKKERRARLAKEQDFISLEDDTLDESEEERFGYRRHGGSGEISLRPKKEKPETRLVRDDEDFAEGFDEFVDDGRISLGRKAEREARRRQKAEMQELINEAEVSEDGGDSEAERQKAYEVAQTRAGLEGTRQRQQGESITRPKTPPRITPLPRLGTVIEKLRDSLARKEYEQARLTKKLAELKLEQSEIADREVEIQAALKAAGEKYETLKAGVSAGSESGKQEERGLESLGDPISSASHL